jgi:hypothetical protein
MGGGHFLPKNINVAYMERLLQMQRPPAATWRWPRKGGRSHALRHSPLPPHGGPWALVTL